MLTARPKDPTKKHQPCIDVSVGCDWIRVDRGNTADYQTAESLILAAMAKIETHCKQPIFSREYYGFSDGFCDSVLQSLNVTAVSAVHYQTKGDVTWTLLDEADYDWRETGEVYFFPLAQRLPNVSRVRVTYTAGYAYEAVPHDILQAVRLLIGRWFDNRADERKDVPTQVDWLIGSYVLPIL
ncbi:head-tail connector protein [Spirosoma sp.]|uniref:head-tail connector protein n=1 Tax=Spirosoma sp. TaxID=1899569 RepID=UPI003B3B3DA8